MDKRCGRCAGLVGGGVGPACAPKVALELGTPGFMSSLCHL